MYSNTSAASKKAKSQIKSTSQRDLANLNRRRQVGFRKNAMRVLWQDHLRYERGLDSVRCATFYASVSAEVALFEGPLGVRDDELIAEGAELFGFEADDYRIFYWELEAQRVREADDRRRAAAIKRTKDGAWSCQVTFAPICSPAEAAATFKLDEETKRRLFGGKPIRAADRSFIKAANGRWLVSRAINTGMPTWKPDTGTVVRAVPDGPGADRFTTAERKAMCAELGVKIDTLRRRERELAPDAFDKWAAKLRRTAATKARKAAEQAARAGKRRRKPGKKAAVRRWIEWNVCMGERRYSERHALRILKDLTTDQILARCPPLEMVCIGGSEGATTVTDVTDKNASHPVFSEAGDAGETRDKNPVWCHDVTDSDTDKNASHPALSRNSNPDDIGIATHADDTLETQPATVAPAIVVDDASQGQSWMFVPRSNLIRPAHLTIVVEHCGNPSAHLLAGGETGDRPRDADRDAQLAALMALIPGTVEEAARIDREMGPDDDAWWAVQIIKAQVPATCCVSSGGSLSR